MSWTKSQLSCMGLTLLVALLCLAPTVRSSRGDCSPNEGTCAATTDETRPMATDSILLQTRSTNIKRTYGAAEKAIDLDHDDWNWGNDCQTGKPGIQRRRSLNDFCSCRRRHSVNYDGEDPRWRCRGETMVYSESGETSPPSSSSSSTTASPPASTSEGETTPTTASPPASTSQGATTPSPSTASPTTYVPPPITSGGEGEIVIDEPAQDTATTPPTAPVPSACLCVFDIDRTLTGKQQRTDKCPNNEILWNLDDYAYEGGKVTLSDLARQGIDKSFCNQCYLGITSAGAGSGATSAWNAYILSTVMRGAVQDAFQAEHPEALTWSFGRNQASHQLDVNSPYVLLQPDKQKQDAVELIRQWYEAREVYIEPGEVYFFGDRTENIEPFSWKGFNSREVSCGLRDYNGVVGYCGGRLEEVVKMKGNWECSETGR
mmetsp:Transcript_76946/g.160099  ORF Transcript_76946/g.160099 Transcript_76946/m.160099 type:complete len:432 (+) Transcript_76946:92-1387(+)